MWEGLASEVVKDLGRGLGSDLPTVGGMDALVVYGCILLNSRPLQRRLGGCLL